MITVIRKYNSSHSVKFEIARLSLLVFLFLFIQSCITPFEPEVDEATRLITIEGRVIKGEEEQELNISWTSNLANPVYLPISGCTAAVIDDQGNQSFYSESNDGHYTLRMNDEDLAFDRQYKIQVTTPDGDIYESDFETITRGADIDSVYWVVEEQADKVSGEMVRGVQFYTDLKAPDTISRYFRWVIEETYEIRSVAPITIFFNSKYGSEQTLANDVAYFMCWKTGIVSGLYLSSTINLTVNEKKQLPLHYVSNQTDRLLIKYSALIKQFAMDEEAFTHYEIARNSVEGGGGLYSQQPGQSITNIKNINDPDEIVMGYFWMSELKEQRLFVPYLDHVQPTNPCTLVLYDYDKHRDGPWPRYIFYDMDSPWYTSTPGCFNCVMRGGYTTVPEFW